MTRINLINPRILHDKHLLAEYRELPRVFKLVEAAEKRHAKLAIPKDYVLGTGHVTFFYDKLAFLEKRFKDLVAECRRRGFNVMHQQVPSIEVNKHWWNDYDPTPQAVALNLARIKERMPK